MTGAASSPTRLREVNARLVLGHLWDTGAVTGSDLMAVTGLSRATVHGVCDQLMRLGWIHEVPDQRQHGDYRLGRPARRYEFAADAGVVLGLDAGQHRVKAVVADLRGRRLGRAQAAVDLLATARKRQAAVSRAAVGALKDSGRQPVDVLAAVVAVPAPVDRTGRTAFAGNEFWQRMNPDLVTYLPRAHGWTTIVDNDANLAAIAETAQGQGRDVRDHMTILIDEALGAGVVEDGRLLRGLHGGAGEMRFLDLLEGVGSADGVALLLRREARELLASADAPSSAMRALPPERIDAEAVLDAAEHGDPVATDLVHKVGVRLARVLAALTSVFDVGRVILAGEIAERCGAIAEVVTSKLPTYLEPPRAEILISTLGGDVVATGAVQRAISHVREHALELELEVEPTTPDDAIPDAPVPTTR